jgi:hypothetical protein
MQNVFSYYEITFIQVDNINYYKLTDKYTKYMNLLHMMELKLSQRPKVKIYGKERKAISIVKTSVLHWWNKCLNLKSQLMMDLYYHI